MMKFSVLMSLYHAEKAEFLHECLSSLTVQTRLADEIVIVFDGKISTELECVVEGFQAALNIIVIKLPENAGLGNALNIGINHCSHEYIFRMDSDDIALPNRFEKQAEYLIAHPEIDLLGAQIAEFDTQPEQIKSSRVVPQTHEEIVKFAKKRNPFNHMTVVYKKSAVIKAGSYQHHLFMEDYNLWLRMLAQGVQTANLPETLVLARTGNSMIERRRGWAYVQSEWQLYDLKNKLLIQNPVVGLFYFMVRGLSRLLPINLLVTLYTYLHPKYKSGGVSKSVLLKIALK